MKKEPLPPRDSASSSTERLLCALLEELPSPAVLFGPKGRLLAVNHRFELAVQFTLTQLRYLKKIRQFSIKRSADGEFSIAVYGHIQRVFGRSIQPEGCAGFELILCSDLLRNVRIEAETPSFCTLIGKSKPFLACIDACRRAVMQGQYTLLTGESGTGKQTLARCMHLDGPFPERKFICLNNNVDFMEFFSGAPQLDRSWYGERLHHHTLYIDEVANFNHYNQDRLFFLLRNSPIGDYNVICATSADLHALLRRGEWHRNLYDLLLAQCIRVPALRERREDIPLLAEYYLARANEAYNRRLTISASLMARMEKYDWPGNFYEMESVLSAAVRANAAVEGPLAEQYVENAVSKSGRSSADSDLSLARAEKDLILRALNTFSDAPHPKESAAKALGISLATLYRKIDLYGIQFHRLFET